MNLFRILLALHIAGGTVSLVLGLLILLSRKGGPPHRNMGTIYFWSMLISSMAALPMSYLHPNYFLFIIGVFSSYLLLTGKRYLRKKKPSDTTAADWVISGIMLVFGTAFVAIGGYYLLRGVGFGLVPVVFGTISILSVFQDWVNYTGRAKIKNAFLVTHLQRMTASYIAAVTAFLVVNNTYLPGTLAWLLPTVVLTPLIFTWTKKYRTPKRPDPGHPET
jgi:uncharacterized membrane protein